MAQGNIIQGQASGKLGDTVLMVRNGTQVSRVYTTSGARSGDAASLAARLQRVRFGAASNQWQLYRYICTRMFRKGRATAQSDYNYFVKRNVEFLPYFTKIENADGVCCMMPGQFSEGTSGRIELLSFFGTHAGTDLSYTFVQDTINPMPRTVNWSATVSTLKDILKTVYPNARKVTYLLVSTSTTTITEASESFVSQFFQHHPVIVDMYAESVQGENDMTITEFFASRINDENIKALLSAQEGLFARSSRSIEIGAQNEAQNAIVEALGILIFASNDLVSDCYTTILPPDSLHQTRGVYAVWHQYRTDNALQVACDSYGYQTGVMRDTVASSRVASSEAVMSYAQKLSVHDTDATIALADELDHTDVVLAKAVRSLVPANID